MNVLWETVLLWARLQQKKVILIYVSICLFHQTDKLVLMAKEVHHLRKRLIAGGAVGGGLLLLVLAMTIIIVVFRFKR